jgi:hypothetical protein
MADLSDVEDSLVATIASILYPNGVSVPSALPAAQPAKVFTGWPTSVGLDRDLKSGFLVVNVWPIANSSHDTTLVGKHWNVVARPAATLTVSQTASTATLGGTGGLGQLAGIRLNEAAYIYPWASSDTMESAAAALAALVPGASSSGSVITVPEYPDFLARTGAQATIQRETRRTVQDFQVIVWTATSAARDMGCSLIDGALSDMDFIMLSDGTPGRLEYRGTATDDVVSKEAMWKRTLHYSIEYGTTITQQTGTVLFTTTNINAAAAVTLTSGAGVTNTGASGVTLDDAATTHIT